MINKDVNKWRWNMRIKAFAQGRAKIICTIIGSIGWFIIVITCAVYILATDMYDGNYSVIVFVILLCSVIVNVLFLLYLKYRGIFTCIYITDAGVGCKNELLHWDEVKITGFTLNDKQPQYYLLFDREYQYGKQNLIKKMNRGAYLILNDSYLNGLIPIILNNIKSNVVFLNIDGNTKVDISELPLYVSNVFANHVDIVKNTAGKDD